MGTAPGVPEYAPFGGVRLSGQPLFEVLANMAGIVLAIAGVQIFIANRRSLPRAVRPAAWRDLGLLVCSGFHAFFAFFVIRDHVRSLSR